MNLAKDRDSLNGQVRGSWRAHAKPKHKSAKDSLRPQTKFQNHSNQNKIDYDVWGLNINQKTKNEPNTSKSIKQNTPQNKNQFKEWSWEQHSVPDQKSPQLHHNTEHHIKKQQSKTEHNNKPELNKIPNNNAFMEGQAKIVSMRRVEPIEDQKIQSFGTGWKANESDPRTKVGSPARPNHNLTSVNAFTGDSQKGPPLGSGRLNSENLFTSQSKSNISSKPADSKQDIYFSPRNKRNPDPVKPKTSIEGGMTADNSETSPFGNLQPKEIKRLEQRAEELKNCDLNVSLTNLESNSPITPVYTVSGQQSFFGQVKSKEKTNLNPNHSKGKVFASFGSNVFLKEIEEKNFETLGNMLVGPEGKISGRTSKGSMQSRDNVFQEKRDNGNFFKEEEEDELENKGTDSVQTTGFEKETKHIGEKLGNNDLANGEMVHQGEFITKPGKKTKLGGAMTFSQEKRDPKPDKEEDGAIVKGRKAGAKDKDKFQPDFFENRLNASFEDGGIFKKGKDQPQLTDKAKQGQAGFNPIPPVKTQQKTNTENSNNNINFSLNTSFKNQNLKSKSSNKTQEDKPIALENQIPKPETKNIESTSHKKSFQITSPNTIFGTNESVMNNPFETPNYNIPNYPNHENSIKVKIREQKIADILKTTIQREISFEMRQVNNQLQILEQNQLTPGERRKEARDRFTQRQARINVRNLVNSPMIFKGLGANFKIDEITDSQNLDRPSPVAGRKNKHLTSKQNSDKKTPKIPRKIKESPSVGVVLAEMGLAANPSKRNDPLQNQSSEKKNVFGVQQEPACISQSMPEEPKLENSLQKEAANPHHNKALSVRVGKPPRKLKNKPKNAGKFKKNIAFGSNIKQPVKHPKKRKNSRKAARSASKMQKRNTPKTSRAKSVSKPNKQRRQTAPRKAKFRKKILKIELPNTTENIESLKQHNINVSGELGPERGSRSPWRYKRNLQEERNKFKWEQLKKQEMEKREIKEKAKRSKIVRKAYMKKWARKANPEQRRRKKEAQSRSVKKKRDKDSQKSTHNTKFNPRQSSKQNANRAKSRKSVPKNNTKSKRKSRKRQSGNKSVNSFIDRSERAESLYEVKRRSAKETKLKKKNAFKARLKGINIPNSKLPPKPNTPQHQIPCLSTPISKPVPLPAFAKMHSGAGPTQEQATGNKDNTNRNKDLRKGSKRRLLQVDDTQSPKPFPQTSDEHSQDPQGQSFYHLQKQSKDDRQNQHLKKLRKNSNTEQNCNIFMHERPVLQYPQTNPELPFSNEFGNHKKRMSQQPDLTSISEGIKLQRHKVASNGNLIGNMNKHQIMDSMTEHNSKNNALFKANRKPNQRNNSHHEQYNISQKFAQSRGSIRDFKNTDPSTVDAKLLEHKRKSHFKNDFFGMETDSADFSIHSKEQYKLYQPNRHKHPGLKFQSSRFLETRFKKKGQRRASKGNGKTKREDSRQSAGSYSQKFQKKKKVKPKEKKKEKTSGRPTQR